MTREFPGLSYERSCGCAVALGMIAAMLAGVALYSIKTSREKIANAGSAQGEIFYVSASGYEYKFTVGNKVYTGTWDRDPEPGHHKGDLIPVSYSKSDPWINNFGTTFRVSIVDTPAVWWTLAALFVLFAISSTGRNPRSWGDG